MTACTLAAPGRHSPGLRGPVLGENGPGCLTLTWSMCLQAGKPTLVDMPPAHPPQPPMSGMEESSSKGLPWNMSAKQRGGNSPRGSQLRLHMVLQSGDSSKESALSARQCIHHAATPESGARCNWKGEFLPCVADHHWGIILPAYICKCWMLSPTSACTPKQGNHCSNVPVCAERGTPFAHGHRPRGRLNVKH